MKLANGLHISLVALAMAGALSGCADADPSPASETEGPTSASSAATASVPLSAVPLDVQRRALRHFQEVRAAGQSWQSATLAPYAVPMWRPDLAEVAYYELSAFGPKGEPQGYLIVATGEHDDPLPLVSQSGPAPSARLREQAKVEPSRFYFVGTISFAAEDAQGHLLASLGAMPQRLVWKDAEIAALGESAYDGFSETESAVSAPPEAAKTRLESQVRRAYTPQQPFAVERFRDWSEAKRGFAASYSRLLAERAKTVQPAWQLERALTEHGESLAIGEAQWIGTLEPLAKDPVVSGPGAEAVSVKRQVLENGETGLLVEVATAPALAGAPVEIDIEYASGRHERVRLGVYRELARAEAREAAVLPRAVAESPLTRLESGVTTKQNPNGCVGTACRPRIIKSTARWYAEADNLADAQANQAWYGQLKKNESYNPYECVSGCGGTAWAMLIAWTDHRASMPTAETGWEKRWGLFRKDAAEYPAANAVAPLAFSADGARRLVGSVAGSLERVLAACGEDSDGNSLRWTAPNVMTDVDDWIHARSWADIKTDYSLLGRTSLEREEMVTYEIQEKNRPAIAGIGWLEHYTLVYGIETTTTTVSAPGEYSQTTTERWRVNNGWGSQLASDATIAPHAFFVGRLRGGDSDKLDSQKPPEG